MALEVITKERRVKDVGKPALEAKISIVPKRGRITINKTTLEVMVQNYKRNFNNVQLLKDPEASDTFWIKPCDSIELGSRKLRISGKNTRSLSCSLLLQRLNWLETNKKVFPVMWDKKHQAIKIELTD